MPNRAPQQDDPEALALEAINELFEARLESIGHKQAHRYLRTLAARLDRHPPSRVVGISEPPADRRSPKVQAWLQERVAVWLSRYG